MTPSLLQRDVELNHYGLEYDKEPATKPGSHVAARRTARAIARGLLLSAFRVTERLVPDAGLLLTFDDGPDPDVTPAILELLAKHNAKAIFFVVGNRIRRAPHMLARILQEGHLIGNHTFRHPLDGTPAFADYYRDVQACQIELESQTGIRPTLFRPPMGALTFGSLVAPRVLGLKTLLWSVDVGDWRLRCDGDAALAGERLAENARPGDVVLLHDDNPCAIPLLQVALPRLASIQLNRATCFA